jgi:hypothetical protein
MTLEAVDFVGGPTRALFATALGISLEGTS